MTGSPRLNPMSNTRNGGLLRLFLVSIFVAAGSVTMPFLDSLVPNYYLNTINGLPFDISFCLSGIWVLLVVFAVKSYGKRGLWLLIEMPVALYVPVILALAELGWINPAI
jgi:hypothetical protein